MKTLEQSADLITRSKSLMGNYHLSHSDPVLRPNLGDAVGLIDDLLSEVVEYGDLLELAWVVIKNVDDLDHSKQTPRWQGMAKAFEEKYLGLPEESNDL